MNNVPTPIIAAFLFVLDLAAITILSALEVAVPGVLEQAMPYLVGGAVGASIPTAVRAVTTP